MKNLKNRETYELYSLLWATPTTAAQCKNQLESLDIITRRNYPEQKAREFCPDYKPSKRRTRLAREYWAFAARESGKKSLREFWADDKAMQPYL
jgi:hypothetical protein